MPHRLTSRFFLNLRSITYHQLSTQNTTSTLLFSKLRTSQHTISSFERDRSFYNSGTSPNESDIQRAEAVDLEAMELQIHHNGDAHDLGSNNDIDQRV
jgi:hypothetical protein